MPDRRRFLKSSALAAGGLAASAAWPSILHARRPANQVVVAVMGVNSRGAVLAESFARQEDCEVAYVCDVDVRAAEKTAQALWTAADGREPAQSRRPEVIADVRRALDDPDVDVLVIAAPDHWHAPAALMAMKAGKDVYVEKPCGHNARECEILVEAQARYGRVVQMGNQQRSAPESIEVIQAIHEGLIGRPYFARAWYANTRGSIGHGQAAPVPEWLDWELWQGPAPRTGYRDNVVHYNWHWFRHWGTGEICNNGTHELDVCRWALQVAYPTRVTSSGGRYHHSDDWEFPDTHLATFEFDDAKQIVWDGRSSNGYPLFGRGRGAIIQGTDGTVLLDRDGYIAYDLDHREKARRLVSQAEASMDTRGGGDMTDLHIANFLEAVRGQGRLNAPIHEAARSVILCHVGNIAQQTGRALRCDPFSGRIVGDDEAMASWDRSYEPGWELTV